MVIDKKSLPDDSALLKQMLLETVDKYEKELKDEKFRYKLLEEKYLTLKRKFFSSSSEKLSKEDQAQMLLFNEAEDGSGNSIEDNNISAGQTVVKGYTRTKRGRKPISDALPREEIIHDLSPEEKKCACCGDERPVIGKEVSEELDIIPAKIKVNRHIRLKYGPCQCDGFLNLEIPEVKTAVMPARMIPKSIVSPGLLAYVLVSKYADSLPFYRQSKMFERIDLEISRATLCNWAVLAAEKCRILINFMREDIRGGPLIQMDETTVQVLKEEGRAPESKSYMWVILGYPEDNKPVIIFDYHAKKSKNIPLEFLKGYKGYLQSDGYTGYNEAGRRPGITHVGCFAHARRYFHEASKLSKKSKTAFKGLSYIRKLYKIENDLRSRNLNPVEFVQTRKNHIEPLFDEFKNWLLTKADAYPPESKTGRAIIYTLKEWPKLIRFIDAHFLTPDNNAVENAIRPFVLGRKNWLFSNTPRGAHSSAVIYSLIETAKANKLEPYSYLRYLFTHLPRVSANEEIKKLLPYNLNPEIIKSC